MARGAIRKTPGSAMVAEVLFGGAAGVLRSGETLVASNGRGPLAVRVLDLAEQDVTGSLSEGSPWIVDGIAVAFWLLPSATDGQKFWVEVDAPTSDGELLVARAPLEVAWFHR
ncbi:hypothetical protein [Candidatus Macondimonas diazotrophica]|jgi:hypothetical protein|uniref:Uncharacterized protein n=1 Tax=Candidatus Macondimonas diazotrophica TaxID=2305248 RepID=A0A4Z0F4F1_9GAMM|nr:hypothetical protein [Candidatus Macondimonas diazotrophica]NCU02231.1 hypothetical protein [Candidatus Macondimonas diazotrophica]TFZ81173.1 hypothetical protein E4680_13490 [Candidatus Macondimonas diazotrophica]